MSEHTHNDNSKLFRLFLPALLLFSLYLAYLLAQPFLHAIIMGIVFAALSWPIQKRTLRLAKGRPIFASLLTMFILIVCILLPAFIFLTRLIPQAATSLGNISIWLTQYDVNSTTVSNSAVYTYALEFIKNHLPFIDINSIDLKASMLDLTKTLSQDILKGITTIVSNALTFALHFLLLLLIMFFMLLDGPSLLSRFMYLFPLKEGQTDTIMERLRAVAKAVLVGGLLVALLQGLAGGIGMAIVGMPALFCGAMMAVASLIPVLGTGLVWIPITIWFFLNGMVWQGVFTLIWCGVFVTSIDSFLRPLFMRNSANLSIFFLFMSILGGLKVFGLLGLFYGPLILGFAVAMLSIYAKEYSDVLTSHQLDAPLPNLPKPEPKKHSGPIAATGNSSAERPSHTSD